MTSPAMIDLGVLSEERPAAPPSMRQRWRGWRHHRRPIAAAMIALLAGVTVAASAPDTAAPGMELQFTAPAAGSGAGGVFHLVDDRLYLMRGPSGSPTLSAYRVPSGDLLWEMSDPTAMLFHVADGTPLLSSLRTPPAAGADALPHDGVTALDPDTGQTRWTTRGYLTSDREGMIIVSRWARGTDRSERPGRAVDDPPGSGGHQTLTAVDLVSGEDRWTTGPVQQSTMTGAGHLITADHGRRLTRYDARTGEQVTSTDRSLPIEGAYLSTVGELVLAWHFEQPHLIAFDPATLRQRWSMQLDQTGWHPLDCGPVVCLLGPDITVAVEPATGEVTWRHDRDGEGLASGPIALADVGVLVGGGELIDVVTGERRGRLDRWQPVLTHTGAPVMRWHEARSGGDRTWFGQLRTDLFGVQAFSYVDRRLTECQFTGTHAACLTDGAVGVWRVRR